MSSTIDLMVHIPRRLGLSAFFFCWGLLQAQQVYPVWVTPMPAMFSSATVYLGDFAHIEATAGRINFRIELRDPVEQMRQVHFRLHIERNGTTVMMTDPAYMPPILTLQKGQPIMINGTDLAFYFDLNHLIGVSGFELNNVLAEDFYSICLEVIDFARQEPISDKICISGFLNQLSPPLLYMPQNASPISIGQSTSMMFHWQLTGISLLFQSNISYDFQLRELIPGLNPQDEFESNILIYDQPDVHSYSLIYGPALPPLVKGKTYVWRVRAFAKDYNGMEIPGYFHNNGFSEVWYFNLPDEIVSEGEFCNPRAPKPVQNQVPIRQLSVNDIVHIGHFDLAITSLENSSGAGSRGRGKVAIPFLNMEVSVSFDSLSVNDKKDAFAGQVNADHGDLLVSKLKGNRDGTIDFADAGLFSEGDVSRITALARADSPDASFSLPVSLTTKLRDLFGVQMPCDLIVSDMWFTPSGAAFDAIMLVPDGNGGHARFGASNIDIDNAGLDLSDLHLFLAENTTMPGFDKQPVIVLAKGAETNPANGSYMRFECNGFKEYNLQGRYVFDNARLVRASNANLPASASFTINTPTWGNFIATASMPDFAIPGMEDWRFKVNDAVADFAVDESIDNKLLAKDSYILAREWKGFYINQFKATLPQELRFGSEHALEMITKDMAIDSEGVSSQAIGTNLLALGTGTAGEWGLSFDTLQLHIEKDTFRDAAVKGKIIITPIGDTTMYAGKLFIDGATDQYALDLIPQGAVDLPYLKGAFDFKSGSVVSIRKETPFCVTQWKPYADLNVTLSMNMQEGDFTRLGGQDMPDVMAEVKTGLGSSGEFAFQVSGLDIDGFKINHPDLPQGKHFGFDDISTSGNLMSLAGVNMDLGGFDLLEEEFELDGMKKGLGMCFHLSSGDFGVVSKFWALDNGMSAAAPFSFAKIEMDFPRVIKKLFNCECKTPEAGSDLPDYCHPPVPPEVASTLAVGSTVQIGHFKMEVTTLSGNSGTGKMAIPFLGNELAVNFWDLQLDAQGLMTEGRVQSAMSGLFADLVGDAMQTTPGPLKMDKITDAAGFMEKVTSHMKEMRDELKCPVSVGAMVNKIEAPGALGTFDFIMMGINFGTEDAKLNSIAIFETPEGKYLKFGIAGINFRPDGFDMNELNLFLDKETTVPAYDGEEIRLLASKEGDPASGSYVSYDCDGFKAFNLKARYTFKNSLITDANNPAMPAEALLSINAPSWGNFISTAVISPFVVPGLNDWTFEPQETVADFSTEKNLEELFFPDGYRNTGVDFKGFYVKSLKVTLPEDLAFGNKHALEMTTENLIIDHQGVTGALKGLDVLPLHPDTANGWNLSINELQLNMLKNNFVDAEFKGDVWIAPRKGRIAYEGTIYKEPVTSKAPNAFYAVDLAPIGFISDDSVKINFRAGDGGLFFFRKRAQLDASGHPIMVKNSAVYDTRWYALFNPHLILDFPHERMLGLLAGIRFGNTTDWLNYLGFKTLGSKEAVEIINLGAYDPVLLPERQTGIEKYVITRRFKTTGHQ